MNTASRPVHAFLRGASRTPAQRLPAAQPAERWLLEPEEEELGEQLS